MGDMARDPIDHERTSRPRVGQTLKSAAKLPGIALITVGLAAFAICLTCFARHQEGIGTTALLVALVAIAVGAVWLAAEARRVRRLKRKHTTEHGGPVR